jgi:hypothetical protein
MAPVKFDDISKEATAVINDDYQLSGFVFKAKQKTSWQGSVLSSQVDLFPAKDSCKTPAKLTWKLPSPLGLSYFAVDKLEMDKGGKFKLEASTDKISKGLKVECKSDLQSVSELVAGCTYTGLKDLQVKLEGKAMKPADAVFEATYCPPVKGAAVTVGAKATVATITAPDLGARVLLGPMFFSLMAKQKFSVFSAGCSYKVSDVCKCAATYEHGGKASGAASIGVAYSVSKGTTVKAKVQQDQTVSCGVKHDVSKGFTVTAGAKFDPKKMDVSSCGLSLSIE